MTKFHFGHLHLTGKNHKDKYPKAQMFILMQFVLKLKCPQVMPE